MILNEKKMQMARELARELVRVGKVEEEEAKEVACYALTTFKNAVAQAWEAVKEIVQTIYDSLTELNNEKEHPTKQNWRLPIKMDMPEMPDLRLSRMMNIRSHI